MEVQKPRLFIFDLNDPCDLAARLQRTMTPDALDPSVLFATEHGAVRWTPDGRLTLSLADRDWTVVPDRVAELHEALQTLAGQVYRCDCDCRWQLRMDEHSTAVLGTDDVLRLHSLLRGTVVMLELHDLLDDAAIDPPTVESVGR